MSLWGSWAWIINIIFSNMTFSSAHFIHEIYLLPEQHLTKILNRTKPNWNCELNIVTKHTVFAFAVKTAAPEVKRQTFKLHLLLEQELGAGIKLMDESDLLVVVEQWISFWKWVKKKFFSSLQTQHNFKQKLYLILSVYVYVHENVKMKCAVCELKEAVNWMVFVKFRSNTFRGS